MTFSNYFSSVPTEASEVSTSYPGSFLRSLLSTRLARCLAHDGKDSPRCWHRMDNWSQIKKRRWRDERDTLRNTPYLVSFGKIMRARSIDFWKVAYYQQCSAIYNNNRHYYTFKLHSRSWLVNILQLIVNVQQLWRHFLRKQWVIGRRFRKKN